MANRIFLVGLMGSGKSYWGEKIAALFHRKFIDLDTFIKEKERRNITEIFEQSGETYFRLLEKKYLGEIIVLDNIVVATGGGTPCFHNNMQSMNAAGETYYLKTKIETIVARLQSHMHKRPLLKGKSHNDLPAFLMQQLKEREPFYLQATHVLTMEEFDIKKIMF